MSLPAITAEEAIRKVLSLPASRRAAALRELLHGNRATLNKALEMLPTAGNAPHSMLGQTEIKPEIRIGPYLLRSVLGEGGFGIVWLAEQDEPLRRSVAFKILRPDRLDASSRARFESERHVVALLDHPGLIKIFEAGESPDGRPWFTMELAAGSPITQACDVAGLSLGQRIDLMSQVCRAVHHAHQRGVIHRDLKPSNILVSLDADEAVVKIIDFGIARAAFDPMNPDERAGALVGTPSFMAPEARNLRTGEADSRMDIYALGAVMLRLLTDCLPDDSNTLVAHKLFEKLSNDEKKVVVENRNTTLSKIISTLNGDLDAIIARCLRRDPRGRYDSALALAQDLERFRRGESVQARPDTPPRKIKRAINHHPLAVSLALIAIVVLSASLVTARSQRAVALAAKDRTEIASQSANDATVLITELLTEIVSKRNSAPLTSVDILAEASRLAGLRLNNDPIMEARVRASMGHLWTSQNRNDLAAQELSRAIELLQSNDQARLLAETELLLAGSLRADGSFVEARRNANKARLEFMSESPSDTDDIARACLELARISAAEGKNIDAAAFLEQATTALKSAPELNHKLLKKINSLSQTLSSTPNTPDKK
ncbi:MAG: serine/threonine protein kinase [Phycisphaerales bacterium]|nr:serine/threonine protein kinase [Phycisphaerales bacterium]